jgi:cytochrome P450
MSSIAPTGRADRPVTRVDFVNLRPEVVPDAPAPQPDNHALAAAGALPLGYALIACSRSLVEETLRDPGVFSSADLVDQGNVRPLIPLAIDPPDHLRYRRLLDPMFGPRQIDRLEVDITMRVNHFIDRFASAGACDFTAEFAELFPSSVFLGMMGLDWDELDTLVALRDGILRPGTDESTPEERTRIQKDTAQRVYRYFDSVLDERARAPRDDLLSQLSTAEAGGEQLTREEMLDICFVLLTAGLDTVTDSLTCFWAFLAQHPDHRCQLVERPEAIPAAVEELLRWETPVPAVVRWAREDRDVGEHPVGAGHLVMANLSSANLDPEVYPDALEVRFDREVNRHVAFGAGVHRCLGSHLARRELRIALAEWHRRIPEYSLAPGYTPAFRPPLRFVPDLQLVWPTSS